MRVVDLDQRTDEWKQWRKLGVTATDSPVLFGLVPEQTPLSFGQKTGLKEPTDLSDIPAVRWGLEHEDYARSLWELKHGDIASPLCVESDANPIFRASLDGYTTNGEVLEIKCPYPDGITIMDVKIRRENSDAYKRYFIQVQHQLMVSGSLLAHLVLDEDELIEFEISRDENVINEIKQKGEEFFKAVLKRDLQEIKPAGCQNRSRKKLYGGTLRNVILKQFLLKEGTEVRRNKLKRNFWE